MGPAAIQIAERNIPPGDLFGEVNRSIERAGTSSGAALLLIVEPAGSAAVLGRYQRAASALRPERVGRTSILRRRSGGKTVFLGEGVVYVGLVLPSLDYFIRERFPVDRTVNRYIRPILGALEAFGGVSAFYYGTDYIILNRKRAGYISFDVNERGVVLMEAVIGVSKEWRVPTKMIGYPLQTIERPLGDTTMEEALGRRVELDEFASALTARFEGRYGAAFEREKTSMHGTERASETFVNPSNGRSSLRETAIGFFEADAEVSSGRIRRVNLYGDFIANSPAIRSLQDELTGCPVDDAAIREKVEEVFHRPGNFMIGLRPISLIAEVVMEAASGGKG
ncbi:MAG TPA: lipoate protein ligase C-terminal domain-containing protein [Nitrospiria bacterium]|nr:lipoate protein ligase C-terminal domain-containing protein [Nitrospiria bacterium]